MGGVAPRGPSPLVLRLALPGAWADVWERGRLECAGLLAPASEDRRGGWENAGLGGCCFGK